MKIFYDYLKKIEQIKADYQILEDRPLILNPRLSEKINNTGDFKNFYGDTIVFDLNSKTKKSIETIRDKLYIHDKNIISEKLNSNTFHMTIYDLNSSTHYDNVYENIEKDKTTVKNLFKNLTQYKDQTISMRSIGVFNIANIALVLGFIPKEKNDYLKLMELRDKFQLLKENSNLFIPHITLAYFKGSELNSEQIIRLNQNLGEINKENLTIYLDLNLLSYQTFTSMNKYNTVFNLL